MSALRIEGDFNVVQAAAQREHLLGWLASTEPGGAAPAAASGAGELDAPVLAAPVLDLGGVEAFDSAGVQLLLALHHSLANRGQVLQLANAPAPVRDALRCYGLLGLLNGPAPLGDA